MASIRALERGIDVLFCFDGQADELGVTDVSRRIGLNKATTSRLLQTLAATGLIAENPDTRKYRLTFKLYQLVNAQVARFDVRLQALPYMQALRDRTQETVLLYIPTGVERTCIEQVESPQEIRRSTRLGRSLPITSGATGQVLLAWLPEEEVDRILEDLPMSRLSPLTMVDRAAFKIALGEIRLQGYAIAVDQTIIGVSGISCPIRDFTGRAVAALSVSGPSSRWTRERMEAMAGEVMAVARQVSAKLGFPVGSSTGDEGVPAPAKPRATRRATPPQPRVPAFETIPKRR